MSINIQFNFSKFSVINNKLNTREKWVKVGGFFLKNLKVSVDLFGIRRVPFIKKFLQENNLKLET